MTYASLADLHTYLDIPTGNTTHDTLLTACLARAQAYVDAWCNRTFEAATDTTRHFDAREDVDGRRLWLGADLCAVTSITNGDGVALATSDYVTEPRNSAPYYALKLRSDSDAAWTYADA